MLTRFGRFAIGIDTGLSDATKIKQVRVLQQWF